MTLSDQCSSLRWLKPLSANFAIKVPHSYNENFKMNICSTLKFRFNDKIKLSLNEQYKMHVLSIRLFYCDDRAVNILYIYVILETQY